MKQIKCLRPVLTALLLTSFFSCDNNDEQEKQGISVLSIEASTNFDLSYRTDWNLRMGGHLYDFTITGNKLHAVPHAEPFHFAYGQEHSNGAQEFVLFPPTENKDTRDLGPVIPPTADQSTWKKFIAHDLLRGLYRGNVVENITDVTFIHHDALLDFKLINIPEEAKVLVVQNGSPIQIITPLRDEADPNAYKAIVFQHNTLGTIGIVIEHNNKQYKTLLKYESDQSRSMAYNALTSAVVRFDVQMDDEDYLIIKNLKVETFSTEWPISR